MHGEDHAVFTPLKYCRTNSILIISKSCYVLFSYLYQIYLDLRMHFGNAVMHHTHQQPIQQRSILALLVYHCSQFLIHKYIISPHHMPQISVISCLVSALHLKFKALPCKRMCYKSGRKLSVVESMPFLIATTNSVVF